MLSAKCAAVGALVLFGLGACSPGDEAACDADATRDLRNAAAVGNPQAQNDLAHMYEYGECVSRDFDEAAKWYHAAADQGHPKAQKVRGFMYAGGVGVPQDSAEAVKWFRKAAEQGHPEAQLGLGLAYFRGPL